jgi:hypothetical protein
VVFAFVPGFIIIIGERRRLENKELWKAQAQLEQPVRDRAAQLNAANGSCRLDLPYIAAQRFFA